jgi:thioredoxin-dependent peroxiredoxin
MTLKRKGLIKIGDRGMTVIGKDIQVGQKAPEFKAHTQAWENFKGLADTQGKVRIIAAVPSLETSVCDQETRRFNEEAAALSENIVILVISADLPYTQKRWCGAAGIDQVITLSDHKKAKFGKKYGCLIKERRILRRAVFVVDQNDTVVYVDYMPALGVEPDYPAVIEAAEQALI